MVGVGVGVCGGVTTATAASRGIAQSRITQSLTVRFIVHGALHEGPAENVQRQPTIQPLAALWPTLALTTTLTAATLTTTTTTTTMRTTSHP